MKPVNKNCTSFTIGGTEDQGLYECELCNLEMNHLKPTKQTKRFAHCSMVVKLRLIICVNRSVDSKLRKFMFFFFAFFA